MSDWINIKDQIPEDGKELIVATSDGRVVGGAVLRFIDHYLGGGYVFETEFEADFEYFSKKISKVTHWMLLPKHPVDNEISAWDD